MNLASSDAMKTMPASSCRPASALEITEGLDDTDYQLRALWGLWLACSNNGEHRVALAHAERLRSIAEKSTEPADPSRRRSNDRPLIAIAGRPTQCQAAYRAHAQSLCRPGSSVAHH